MTWFGPYHYARSKCIRVNKKTRVVERKFLRYSKVTGLKVRWLQVDYETLLRVKEPRICPPSELRELLKTGI